MSGKDPPLQFTPNSHDSFHSRFVRFPSIPWGSARICQRVCGITQISDMNVDLLHREFDLSEALGLRHTSGQQQHQQNCSVHCSAQRRPQFSSLTRRPGRRHVGQRLRDAGGSCARAAPALPRRLVGSSEAQGRAASRRIHISNEGRKSTHPADRCERAPRVKLGGRAGRAFKDDES